MNKIYSFFNSAVEFWNNFIIYFDSLGSTEKLLIYLFAGFILFYVFYRLFGVLVALAFMFAIIIGYTVYMSELTETMNKYEESKKGRLEQIQEEINKDNPKKQDK